MLSIVIPAHNEAKRIAPTMKSYLEYFLVKYPGNFEIIVVLNGCEDNTLEIVNRYAVESREVKVYSIEKRGKGHALKCGFKAASGNIISFTDADGATSPEELDRLMQMIDGRDGIIASRWLRDSVLLRQQGLGRRIASRGLNTLVRLMFKLPFSDTQCGAKVFKKTALDAVIADVKNGDFTFDIELLHKMGKKGFRVVECGITWQDKAKSKLNIPLVVPQMLINLIRLRVNSYRLASITEKTLEVIYVSTQKSIEPD